MQYISCHKCNRHGKTSEPCTCDEVREQPPPVQSALIGLLACPFCGEQPELPDGDGTQYEIECHCGMARSSVQISDLMTIDERVSDDFVDYRYGEAFVLRARDEAVKAWNERAI